MSRYFSTTTLDLSSGEIDTSKGEMNKTLFIVEQEIPSMCAEFDPNGAYFTAYTFYLITVKRNGKASLRKITEKEVREIYKRAITRHVRLTLWGILKEINNY